MGRKLTASDRKALIRLASSLPQGSDERRAILAAVKTTDLFSQKEGEVMGQLQSDLAEIGNIFGGSVTDAVGAIKDIKFDGLRYVAKGIIVVEGEIEPTPEENAMMIAQELKKAGLGYLADGSRVDFGGVELDSFFYFDMPKSPSVEFGLSSHRGDMVVMTGYGFGLDAEETLWNLFGKTVERLGGDRDDDLYDMIQATQGLLGSSRLNLAEYYDAEVVSNAGEAAAAAKKMSSEWTKEFNKIVAYWKKNGLPE